MRFKGFIGPSYTHPSKNVDAQRCVNLYLEINKLGTGKEQEDASLVPTPGLTSRLTLPTSPVRGVYAASDGTLYAVGGNKFYSISSAWVATEEATLDTDTGYISWADNGTYVVFVDGTSGYTWNLSTDTYAKITDGDFNAADQVTYQDGYFIFNNSGTQQFFISGLNDITFDALDFASAESKPDDLVGLISAHQKLYLFGENTTEVFYNSGAAAFPFERIQGTVSDIGCSAPFSIDRVEDSILFLGGSANGKGIVYQMQNMRPVRISTESIESVIRERTDAQIALARAWTYQDGGHSFYCLNIPGAESTWVYDLFTQTWHERVYRNKWSEERHRADSHALAFGSHVVGDYETGVIYTLDMDVYTDNGNPIPRIRQAPHLTNGLKRIFYNSFQLDMETGVGLDGTGQGTDPRAILQWSDDGGHTFSNEYWRPVGKIGKKSTRVIWRRLGQSRDRVFRVTITDPVKVVLIGAEIQAEVGDS